MVAPQGFPGKSSHKFARWLASRLHLPCESAVQVSLLDLSVSVGIVKSEFRPSGFPRKFNDFVKDDLI